MKVRWTRPALNQLEGIATYIAHDSPRAAQRMYARLLQNGDALDQHPERYPVVRARPGGDIRKLVVNPYLIFYSVGPDSVQILMVVHGARDYTAVLEAL